MYFKIILIITNLVRRIHNKYIVCDCKLMIRAESPLINAFPDINELYKNTDKNLRNIMKDICKNKNEDPFDFEIDQVSVFVEDEKIEEPIYSNYKIANKKFYYF